MPTDALARFVTAQAGTWETALAELDSDRYAIAVVGDDLGMHRGVDLLDAVEALDRRPRTRLGGRTRSMSRRLRRATMPRSACIRHRSA